MIDIHDIPSSLRRELSARQMNVDGLAQASGVHRSLIHRILSGKAARSDTLAKLELALETRLIVDTPAAAARNTPAPERFRA